MRVVFINRFFYPDHSATSQLLADIAFGLAERGIPVSVITSRQLYDDPSADLKAHENVANVDIQRIWTTRFGRQNLALRAVDYATFYLALAWRLFRALRPGDIVVAKTDPPMLSVVAGPIARRRGAGLINWLQDLFPEVAEALGVGSSPAKILFPVLRRFRDSSLRRAALNVAIGELMRDRLRDIGVEDDRIRLIPNWADCEAIKPIEQTSNPLRKTWDLHDSFVVAYSGNLGRAHEVDTFLDAIERTERHGTSDDRAPIRWLFIGGGARFQDFRQEIAARGLSTVHFKPYQPRERLSESLSVADVHIVSLRPELEGLIVPSKFYGVAAVARPTIFVGSASGEIGRLLAKNACGLSVESGDGPALAAAIAELASDRDRCQAMGECARAYCEGASNKKCAIEIWHEIVKAS